MEFIKSTLFKQLIVLFIIIGTVFSLIINTNALYEVQKFFSNRTEVFKNLCINSGDVGDITEYPINNKDAKKTGRPNFTQLGYDILLGSERKMVTYVGEIPSAWKDADGLTLMPYTDFSPKRASKQYFGIEPSDLKVDEGKELQKVQEWAGETANEKGKTKVTSIRMYALSKASSSLVGDAFSQVTYSIFQSICGLGAALLKILIMVKNISITFVLDALNLDKMVKLFAKVFVRNQGQLSIFMIIAITSFIFAIVGFALRWVRGKEKTNSLFNILIIAFVGLSVASLCLVGNPTNLGTKASNAVAKLASDLVYDSVAGGTKIWKSTATGAGKNDSTVICYNEITLVNKTLIELQIMNQFGVSSIEDLKTSKLKGGSSIQFDKMNNKKEKSLVNYDNNLGYYYWFANSPAPLLKGDLTSSFRKGRYNSAETIPRMEGLMSYLQQAYNGKGNKTKILNIVDHFANPRTFAGAGMYFLLTIEYIILTIALAGLVLRLLLAKIMVAGSVLGMPIAGPLLITTRPKMVAWGKTILLMLVTYSIQVFVLSVLFDMILNVIGVLLAPNIFAIMLTLAVTIGLFIFLPYLYRQLDKLFESINTAIGASNINHATRSAKSFARGKFNNYQGKSKMVTKTVKDADGNKHEVQVEKKSALQKATAVGAMIAGVGASRQSLTGLESMSKIGNNANNEKASASKALSRKMHGETGQALDKIDQYKQSRYADLFSGEGRSYNNLNYDRLTNSEQQAYTNIAGNIARLEAKKADPNFMRLNEKISAGTPLNSQEQMMKEEFDRDAKNIETAKQGLVKSVENRVNQEAIAAHGQEVAEKADVETRTNEKSIKGYKGDKTKLEEISANTAESKQAAAAIKSGDTSTEARTPSQETVDRQKKADGTYQKGESKVQQYFDGKREKYKKTVSDARAQSAAMHASSSEEARSRIQGGSKSAPPSSKPTPTGASSRPRTSGPQKKI